MQVFKEAQREITIFFIAIFVHAVLFGTYRIRPLVIKANKKISQDKVGKPEKNAASFPAAEQSAPLVRALKAMLHRSAETEEMANEIEHQLQASSGDAITVLGVALELLNKAANAKLMAATRSVIKARGLALTPRLSELLLRGYLTSQCFSDFNELFAKVDQDGLVTPSLALLALRASLNTSDLDAALGHMRRLAVPLRTSVRDSPSAALRSIMHQLIALAAQKSTLLMLLQELQNCELCTSWTFEAVLLECVRRGDTDSLKQADEFAKEHQIEYTGAAHSALLRGAGTAEEAASHFVAAVDQGVVNSELLLAAADAATLYKDANLAQATLQHLPPKQSPEVAAAVIRLVSEGPLRSDDTDTILIDLYEKHFIGVNLLLDAHTGQLLVDLALKQHRADIIAQLMCSSEGLQQHALLKTLGSQNRLGHAFEVFHACPGKTASLCNALLDTCIVCKDMKAAEEVMAKAITSGTADLVTYNSMIKACLQNGDIKRLRATIETMRADGSGLAPNCVTFNELIEATIRTNSEGVWALLDEMKSCGLQPNHVTCSILLQSIQRSSRARDVERTLAVVDAMDDSMDEVLLSSVCEACIRVGRSDLLAKQLGRQRTSKRVSVRGAHSFGSIVRAYGVLHDLKGVWDTWREMRMRRITPTSIAIGCMVEALASNGDPESAHELIREMLADADTGSLVNAVIYCSVLKGFSHQRQFGRVWLVYEEMRAEKLAVSLSAYNALIDACARSSDMGRVPQLLQDMAKDGLEPNIVTYSTILKGYCQENRLDKAFELLQEMKQSSKYQPDEITYNTLIDGCARYGLYERGVMLLRDMQEAGVGPSNFTLSVLVKLATRSRRPEKAFELCTELTQQYKLRPNVQVYNNLVHACTANRDMQHALQVLEQMLHERIRPDARTYTLLLRGSIAGGDVWETTGLLRAAYGLRGAHPTVAQFANSTLTSCGKLPLELVTEILEALVHKRNMETVVHLLRDLRGVPGLRIDPKLQLRLTSTAATDDR